MEKLLTHENNLVREFAKAFLNDSMGLSLHYITTWQSPFLTSDKTITQEIKLQYRNLHFNISFESNFAFIKVWDRSLISFIGYRKCNTVRSIKKAIRALIKKGIR